MAQGPEYRSFIGPLAYARVINYDPANHGVYVQFSSGQQLAEPAKVLVNGPADQSRIEQVPLPVIGTWGIVAFPQGDLKSAVWLGAFYQSPVNAVTTSNPPNPADSQTKYMSHASGAYSILDYVGNYTYWSPDGTLLHLNVNNLEPTTYQHVLDHENGQQKLVPVTHEYRAPFGQPAFYASVIHPTGATISIDPDGVVIVQGGLPQQALVSITPDGIMTLDTGSTSGPGAAESQNTVVINPQPAPGGSFMTLTANAGGKQAQLIFNQNGQITSTTEDDVGHINITPQAGNANVAPQKGDANINAPEGNINLTARKTVTISTNDNAITIESSVGDIIINAVNGKITLTAETNQITANGHVLG